MIKISQKKQQWLWGYLFMTPFIIGLVVFIVGPVISVFFISFTEYDNITTPKWVGLQNFKQLAVDPEFRQCLLNTLYFCVGSVPVGVILALFIAILLNQKIKGRSFFRSIYFLPVVSSMVAVAIVWNWIYEGNYGLLNYTIRLFITPIFPGITEHLPHWLSDSDWAMPALIIMSIWKGLGYSIVIYLAGLQDIPQQLYEASDLDGANMWQKFKNITFPMVSPTTFFLLVISTISSFQMFEQAYIMTKGGPPLQSGGVVVGATRTLVYYLYEMAFKWLNMGYAAAIAVVLFLTILITTAGLLVLQKKWVHYQ
jgi:multiple sugar transport system permease protein